MRLTLERLLKGTDLHTLLRHIVPGEGQIETIVALRHLENYVQGAIVQQARIERLHRQLKRRVTRHDHTRPSAASLRRGGGDISAMAREIHFYLICWNVVGRNLRLIQELTKSPAVGRAIRPHRMLFEKYKDMRDHLEHFDDRLRSRQGTLSHRRGPGRQMKQPSDMGNFSRDKYTFGGESLDISRRSALGLQQIVEQVVMCLKVQAWMTLQEHEPATAERIALGFVRNRQTLALMRRLQRDSVLAPPSRSKRVREAAHKT